MTFCVEVLDHLTVKKSFAEGTVRTHGNESGVDVDIVFKAKRRCIV